MAWQPNRRAGRCNRLPASSTGQNSCKPKIIGGGGADMTGTVGKPVSNRSDSEPNGSRASAASLRQASMRRPSRSDKSSVLTISSRDRPLRRVSMRGTIAPASTASPSTMSPMAAWCRLIRAVLSGSFWCSFHCAARRGFRSPRKRVESAPDIAASLLSPTVPTA